MSKLVIITLLISLSFSFNIFTDYKRTNSLSIPWPYSICGVGQFQVDTVQYSQVPRRLITVLIDIIAVSSIKQNFTNVQLKVIANGQYVFNQTIPFEQSFQKGQIIDFKYKGYIPPETPSAIYTTIWTFYSGKTPSGCIETRHKI